jgi:hypothetical protein
VPWSVVLTFTVMPLSLVNFATASSRAFFGTASE